MALIEEDEDGYRRKKKKSSSIASPTKTATKIFSSSLNRPIRSGGKSKTTSSPQLSNDRRHDPNSNRKRSKEAPDISNVVDDSSDDETVTVETNVPTSDELRRARAEYYAKSPQERQKSRCNVIASEATSRSKMPYISEVKVPERIPEDEAQYYTRRKAGDKGRRHNEQTHKKHSKKTKAAAENEYVYARQGGTTSDEYSTEEEGQPVSRSKSKNSSSRKSSHYRRGSNPRRKSETAIDSHLSRRTTPKSRSPCTSSATPQHHSLRDGPQRRSSRDGGGSETKPLKRRVSESARTNPINPIRHASEPIWRSSNIGGRRGSESVVAEPVGDQKLQQRDDRPPIARSSSAREIRSTASMPSHRAQIQYSRPARGSAGGLLGLVLTPDRPKARKTKEKEGDSPTSTSKKERKLSGPTVFGIEMTPKLESMKRVSCLTCGADDVIYLKTAKLECGHRMCHDCLRRIFTMSVTDPAHMPPKCCTDEHIPLRHVEKLFDDKFKKKWNVKYEEYNTKNRLYCPSRGCAEWIRPKDIQVDRHHPGKKFGKCRRCATKVCVTCNGRYHPGNKECPKDPGTIAFTETAKREGWQQCYNCKAMVELKEGCNHMTCRCQAEFCMICGVKWKGCDCPWFNYEAVDNNRLRNMNIPQARAHQVRYAEEMNRRREQEQRDEALARRLQVMGLDEDDHVGNVMGTGNAARNQMNETFVQQARNVLTGNFRNAHVAAIDLVRGRAPPGPNADMANANAPRANPVLLAPRGMIPVNQIGNHDGDDANDTDDDDVYIDPNGGPPVLHTPPRHQLRTPTAASRAFNRRVTRPSERVIPARDAGVGYAAEAARHAPIRRIGISGHRAAGGNGNGNGNGNGTGTGTRHRNGNRHGNGNGNEGVANLVRTADPSPRETVGRIELWRSGIVG